MPVSPILENAIDSLRIGMEYFQRESNYSSRKHAVLTIFHAIELLLKEQLFRTNPVLIYKNIDAKITDDSLTVGSRDALMRLENIGIKIHPYGRKIVERIQVLRNRIEHHRYDHDEQEDEVIIGVALQFIFFFMELVLDEKVEDHFDQKLVVIMKDKIFIHNEREELAKMRFKEWAKKKWPTWDKDKQDTPEKFEGTNDCPICGESWLMIGYHDTPFCFYCNVNVDAGCCEHCGESYLVKDDGCCQHCGRATS